MKLNKKNITLKLLVVKVNQRIKIKVMEVVGRLKVKKLLTKKIRAIFLVVFIQITIKIFHFEKNLRNLKFLKKLKKLLIEISKIKNNKMKNKIKFLTKIKVIQILNNNIQVLLLESMFKMKILNQKNQKKVKLIKKKKLLYIAQLKMMIGKIWIHKRLKSEPIFVKNLPELHLYGIGEVHGIVKIWKNMMMNILMAVKNTMMKVMREKTTKLKRKILNILKKNKNSFNLRKDKKAIGIHHLKDHLN